MDEAVVTTTQAAALLGASRQHVADLADRGGIPSWRNGTHRRFRREDVLAYLTRLRGATVGDDLGAMTLTDRRSLAYGLLLGARLIASPDTVLARARRNLEQLRSVHSDGSADPYVDRWGGTPCWSC